MAGPAIRAALPARTGVRAHCKPHHYIDAHPASDILHPDHDLLGRAESEIEIPASHSAFWRESTSREIFGLELNLDHRGRAGPGETMVEKSSPYSIKTSLDMSVEQR